MSAEQAFQGSKVVILDFGSQYTQVIARRVRESRVYSEILPFNSSPEQIHATGAKGILLSGGPASVFSKNAPRNDPAIFDLGLPVLGICYGVQLIAHQLGGIVEFSDKREYGPGTLRIIGASPLFEGLPSEIMVWNSHGDRLTRLPPGFASVASTENSPFAAIQHAEKSIFGLQFHPEVAHTPLGKDVLENFLYRACGCSPDWTMGSFIEQSCHEIRERVGVDKVVLGLSGGVDSSVAAALIHQAIGDQLTCIFVNNGLLREFEAETVQKIFRENFRVSLKYVDASKRFLGKLEGVSDPEIKRKIIGTEFVRVFEGATEELKATDDGLGKYRFLAQGTLYPDVIESVSISGNPAELIKSHHNVGGLPEKMHFELLEPLRHLFKDEVRHVGLELELPREVVFRQPFPGPGLAVRILGAVTNEYLTILRHADEIVESEMKAADWYYRVWQSFAVLLPIRSVGVKGDQRTYENTVVLRIVESQDGMTANWVKVPYDILSRIASRILNEVKLVNRVCYDISSKPPSTIEWE
ncbi:MAG: glutamine-hydrolyzing GMP synthase [Verrucomicrobia bacterium]|nr:glutamine-hydrolyzing GMP synthase [Verrucomicrobiota bacterium]